MTDSIHIAALGRHVPEERITNADLESTLDTSDAWIREHTGIRERRRAPVHVETSDLGVRATEAALADGGWSPEDIDLLICATSTPDRLVPATGCYIGKKLGISPVTFDLGATCSGFVYGLSVARAMMRDQGYRRVALCVAEKWTKFTDYTDRASAIFFGDGAGTVLLQPERPTRGFEVVDLTMVNLNDCADLVTCPVGGHFRQIGRRVLESATAEFELRSAEMLQRHGLEPGDLRAFIGHQANLRILDAVRSNLGLSPEQHWYNVDWAGNQGGAGVLTALAEQVERRRAELTPGDLILVTVFGAGFTSGSALLRWT